MIRWGLRAVQSALLAVLLAPGAVSAAPITTLVVIVTTGCPVCHAPMRVGIVRGIFERHGLGIRLISPSPAVGLQQVADGTAHVTVASTAAMARVAAQDARLRGIFTAYGDATGKVPTDNFTIIARRASAIREGHLEDLRGKRIALNRGSDGHQYFFYAAAKAFDPMHDVTIVAPPASGLLDALKGGTADAVVLQEPAASQALQSWSDAFVVQRGGSGVQFVSLRIVSARYLAAHPGTVKRYIAAFAEAAQYVRTHPGETTDILLPELGGISRAPVLSAVKELDLDMRVSRASLRAAQQSYEFDVKIGAIPRAPAFDQMFDIRLLRQVERERPDLFSDLPAIPAAELL